MAIALESTDSISAAPQQIHPEAIPAWAWVGKGKWQVGLNTERPTQKDSCRYVTLKTSSQRLEQVKATTFAEEKLLERQNLRHRLKSNVSVLGNWEESRRRIDLLLCLDEQARFVVIEIHHTEEGKHMALQACLRPLDEVAGSLTVNVTEDGVRVERYIRLGKASEPRNQTAFNALLAQKDALRLPFA